MKKLVYQIKNMCRKSGEGSFATQKKREQVLLLVARQLSVDLVYHQMSVTSLKPKHITALLTLWRSQGIATSTVKARMSHLRWWAQKINKPDVIARRNDHYGIEQRRYVSDTSKAVEAKPLDVDQIQDDYVRTSVKMAKAFGLRKEEAIKIQPRLADQGDRLYLKASWCKGGRERVIPIRNIEQRRVLDDAKTLAGSGALIPAQLKYYRQRSRYEAITSKVGLKKLHGLRHRYAQIRYQELTGWASPHCGGPKRTSMAPHQKEIDREARRIISRELGHNRIEIVKIYVG